MSDRAAATGSRAAGPLQGIRVLDACDELGIYATHLLVNLGADVIRPEPPEGDPMRGFPPFAGSVSLYFEHFNAGKRSVTLDLSTETGLLWLGKLVAGCNAIVESGLPATLLSARAGRERLRSVRSDLVLVSVTPFGLAGPGSERRGADLVAAADSGLLALNGRPEERPYRPAGEQAAHMAGLAAANAVLLGVFEQQRTGRGCEIEVPVSFAAALATLQTANANFYTWLGRVPKRRGSGLMPAYRSLFPTADGYVVLVILPGQWPNFLRLLQAHGAAADLGEPQFEDADFRATPEGAQHVNDTFAAFAHTMPKQQLFEAAQRAGLAVTPVNTTADLLDDSFLRRRGFFRSVRQPALGREAPYSGPVAHFGDREAGTRAPAPAAGQDNEAIWVQELQMDGRTLAAVGGGERA